MGMRIRTNVPSLIAQRNMDRNNTDVSNSFERLSTGYRINRSADDAAGLAITENLRAQIRGLNVAKRNANDAVSMVQVAEGGMNEMTNILIRLRELTIQAATDTLGDRERGFLNREYVELTSELDRIGKSTEFNGNPIFREIEEGKGLDAFVIQVGTKESAPEANEQTISIDLKGLKFNSQTLGLVNEEGDTALIGPGLDWKDPNVAPDNAPTRDKIAGRLTSIDNSLQRLASERATLGSVQSRLTSAISNLGVFVENLETSKSRIKDVDFAAETATLTQSRILTQSNLSVLSQANQAPEMALQLLRP